MVTIQAGAQSVSVSFIFSCTLANLSNGAKVEEKSFKEEEKRERRKNQIAIDDGYRLNPHIKYQSSPRKWQSKKRRKKKTFKNLKAQK